MSFDTHPALARALSARGFETATPVQKAVLEGEARGRDMLVSAQTGSGKTVAFGMAIAYPVLGSDERFPPAREPLALVVAPTRELAMQVQKELAWLYAEAGARVVSCVGGMDVRAEARQLAAGAHIVVGTPGRLRDHMERKRLDLSKLKSIVLDEADEMLDMGFREDLEFILDATPQERQTLLFSATIPADIETLAGRYQRDALRIQTAQRGEQHADIEYRAIRVVPSEVEHAIVNVLRFHEAPIALVFCSTRESVKRMHARLIERGFSAVALSGELSQSERTHALQTLRDGRARILVATDVAARGLDLPELSLVIHADLPHDRDTLLHRSGRTGRAGRKGLCVLIVPFNRRRKAEALIGLARLKVAWGAAPSSDEIQLRDQQRFLDDAIFTEPPEDEELALARVLQSARSADAIALALARLHRARLPAPEDVTPDARPVRPDHRPREHAERPKPRFERRENPDTGFHKPRPSYEGAERGNKPMVWFRINIGRERNADPRWLLPLICKAGNLSKGDVGAIRIFPRDTRFQVAAEIADQFELSVRTNKTKEGIITKDEGPPPSVAGKPRPKPEDGPGAQGAREAPPHRPKRPYDKHEARSEHRGFKGKTHHRGSFHAGKPGGEGAEPRPPGAPGARPVSKYAKKKDRRGT